MNNNENIYALERFTPENSFIELQSSSTPPPVYEKNIQDFIIRQEEIIIVNENRNNTDGINTLTPIYIMVFISWLSPFIGACYFLIYITCIRNVLDMSFEEIRAMIILFLSFTFSFIINFIILK